MTGKYDKNKGTAEVKLSSWYTRGKRPGDLVNIPIKIMRTAVYNEELITPEEEQRKIAIADRQAEFDRRRYGD